MSTGEKRPHAEAYDIGYRFGLLFQGRFDRWQMAGSIRRQCALVGDVEHVVIAKMLPHPVKPINMVWQALDRLLIDGRITKAEYGEPDPDVPQPPPTLFGAAAPKASYRWGEKFRGVMFEGIRHEISIVDRQSWGSMLTIKTGPREFSKHMVTVLKQGGRYRHEDGYVRYAGSDDIRACPEETDFFQLCNVPFIPPERRDAFQPKPQRSYSR
jgi:DNA polymerase/3'-5' exonuclease PolX